MAKLSGVHHVALRVTNFEKTLKFFTEGFGCKVIAAWGEGERSVAMIDIGGGSNIELFANGKREEGAELKEGVIAFTHVALNVEDVDACYNRALELGAAPHMTPRDVVLGNAPDTIDARIAFVYGYDGEVIEFFHVK